MNNNMTSIIEQGINDFMNEEVMCYYCGAVHKRGETFLDIHDHIICDDCRRDPDIVFLCPDCGRLVPAGEGVEILDENHELYRVVCKRCADWNYYLCYDCGNYFLCGDTAYVVVDGVANRYCENCLNDYYRCERCGDYFSADNFNADSRQCYECDRRIILEYNADIDWCQFGSFDKHFGIELEIENRKCKFDRDELACKLRDDWLGDHAVYKHDGSLEDGFEVVTHPHTWEEFNKLPWRDILQDISDCGYDSHNNTRCGLHIHVDRKWFGDDPEESYRNIAKLAFVYNWCWNFFLGCSRRTESQYQDWAKRYTCSERLDSVIADLKNFRDHNYSYRYYAINLSNSRTVEFRLGRGTLRYESFIAWIDIHLALVRNVKNINPDTDLTDLSKWLEGIRPETLGYIHSRGLALVKYSDAEEI